MILRIFDTPLIDVLLIVLAIRFIFPGLFGIKSKKQSSRKKQKDKVFVRENSTAQNSTHAKDQGEYIDYEEIK